jgi:hypothetical protein
VAKGKKRSSPEKRTLILWALLARDNAASFQNELKPEPDKADRDALKEDGLVTWEKRGQRIWIEVTEKGWAWAEYNLGAALPANSRAGSQILQSWLIRLKNFMEARKFALADILGPQGAAKASESLVIEALQPASLDYAAVRERIREAYFNLTGGQFNARVLLSDIRSTVKDIDSKALDEALRRMHLEDGTTLSGSNNPQGITQAMRDGELDFKGEPMYVLWITK